MFVFVLLCITLCHIEEEDKAGCFAIIVLQMYCYYKCSIALPRGAIGWSVIMVFPDHTDLLFDLGLHCLSMAYKKDARLIRDKLLVDSRCEHFTKDLVGTLKSFCQ